MPWKYSGEGSYKLAYSISAVGLVDWLVSAPPSLFVDKQPPDTMFVRFSGPQNQSGHYGKEKIPFSASN